MEPKELNSALLFLANAIKNNDFETFVKLFPKTSTPTKIYSKLKEMYDRSLG